MGAREDREKGRGPPQAVPPIGSVSAAARWLDTAEQSILLHSNCLGPCLWGWTTDDVRAAEAPVPCSPPRTAGV